jgi:hypothetical protein
LQSQSEDQNFDTRSILICWTHSLFQWGHTSKISTKIQNSFTADIPYTFMVDNWEMFPFLWWLYDNPILCFICILIYIYIIRLPLPCPSVVALPVSVFEAGEELLLCLVTIIFPDIFSVNTKHHYVRYTISTLISIKFIFLRDVMPSSFVSRKVLQ